MDTNQNNSEKQETKVELEKLYEELKDNELLKKYYLGATEFEKDILNLIKTYERQLKLIELLEEK